MDEAKFQEAHEIFRGHLYSEEGRPFTGWKHPYLRDQEIFYKQASKGEGHDILEGIKWEQWLSSDPERILEAIYRLSHPDVSRNLVVAPPHRDRAIQAPVVAEDRGEETVEGLVELLYQWFENPGEQRFSQRFDGLADFLRENSLPCHGAWLAYLAFQYDWDSYFPMRPSIFQELLQFYGNSDLHIAGKITWERYSYLLQLASLLTERLASMPCGEPDTLEVQSYMWVIAYRLYKGETPAPPPERPDQIDQQEIIKERLRRERERHRRGVLGEVWVLQEERKRLRAGGREDLAAEVEYTARNDEGAGFDIRSFTLSGEKRLIEVKSTQRSPERDTGFALTENERQVAEDNREWRVYRVWDVEGSPHGEVLGNVVQESTNAWGLTPRGWWCRQTGE